MKFLSVEKLLSCIGDIDDFFLMEAETADVTTAKVRKRKRVIKYSIAGIIVSAGLAAMAYWKLGPSKIKVA